MPGWCADRTHFEKVISICSDRRRCLAVDWPGHGESENPPGDFGDKDLVDAARVVIEKSGPKRLILAPTAHAGWIALELSRQLGERIHKIVLLDWLVLEPPPSFLEGLKGLQSRDSWRQVRDGMFSMWFSEAEDPDVAEGVQRDMGSYGYEMWSRAGREISAEYARYKTPLAAIDSLAKAPPVLHMYSIPKDEAFLTAQQGFAQTHPWFSVRRLDGKTHFPCLERPEVVAAALMAA